mmetsp:Transcript_161/g.210  ORF Transcript_161/g.210 Transcript_161/m.210 type:complete len:444 (-) Transcript_161:129-1460(-)
MPIKIKKNSAAAAAAQEAVMVMDHATLIFQDNHRWGNEAAAAAAADISTTSSTSETSISTAVAAACNATLARNMRREATAKRKRQVSEEDDDDIVPKKDARILAMANHNMNFLSKQRDETSSASDEREGEYDTQKGHPNAQYGSNGASMPNHVICPRFVGHGHTYRDFSTHIEEGGMIEKHIESESERNFPACLHAMVSNEHYSHIISWMPHGRAWKVHNKRLLVGDPILGKILGLPSYASFTRELSEWGFKMLHQAGPDYGCYYHECFLRGHPQLTALMKKTSEPDFYAIAKQRPLEKSADVERVLFLADVALQYSFDSSDRGQNEVPAKTASKYPSRVSRKKRSARKKSLKVSPKEKVHDLEDLPPQSEDNPAVIITRLNALMKRTHMTQKQLEKHDKQNGLPRSHAQTMLRSSRSRSQLQKALKKNKRELRKMPKKQDDE